MDDTYDTLGGGFINKVTGKQQKLINAAAGNLDATFASIDNTKATDDVTPLYSTVLKLGNLPAPLPGNWHR